MTEFDPAKAGDYTCVPTAQLREQMLRFLPLYDEDFNLDLWAETYGFNSNSAVYRVLRAEEQTTRLRTADMICEALGLVLGVDVEVIPVGNKTAAKRMATDEFSDLDGNTTASNQRIAERAQELLAFREEVLARFPLTDAQAEHQRREADKNERKKAARREAAEMEAALA